MWLFLTVRWAGLQCVILVFPDHTHLFFGAVLLMITHLLQEVFVVRWLCLALLQHVQGSNISEYCRHYQRSYYEVCLVAPVLGHRPIIVKGTEIGSKGRLAQKVGGSSAQYLSCNVFRDWSIIKFWEINHIY